MFPEIFIILEFETLSSIVRKGWIYSDEDRPFYELVASTHPGDLSLSKSRSPKGLGKGEPEEEVLCFKEWPGYSVLYWQVHSLNWKAY